MQSAAPLVGTPSQHIVALPLHSIPLGNCGVFYAREHHLSGRIVMQCASYGLEGRLLSQVVVEEQRVATRNPRVAVGNAPYEHVRAVVVVQEHFRDLAVDVCLLLLLLCGIGRQGDVHLREDAVQTDGGKALHRAVQLLLAERARGLQVALQSHAVDGHATLLEPACQVEECSGLGRVAELTVVVVEVEFDVGIGLSGPHEG